MPKISVLTPCYLSDPDILREMIDSVLTQTFGDFEFILLNDSPDDKTIATVVASYRDDRIVYVENERNLGISASRNKLLAMARGEYLAICDHDDICVPTRFERQAEYLDGHPDCGVVSGQLHAMHSGIVSRHPVSNMEIKRALAVKGCVAAHPAAMIRKKLLVENGIGWDKAFSPCEDYKLWADLIDKCLFHNIDAVLLEYRDDAGNTSHRQCEKMDEKARQIQFEIRTKHGWLMSSVVIEKRFFLFGLLLLKTVVAPKRIKMMLFGFLPLLNIKIKEGE